MGKHTVTLKDVAERAGMSVTQVSRALNGYNDVSASTKERIKALADEMGYIKNVAAQKLATQSSNQIALVIKGMENDNKYNTYSAVYSVIRGIEAYTSSINYDLTIYTLRENRQSYVAYFNAKGITSAILIGFEYNDPYLSELLESPIPCVCIDIPTTGGNNGCIIVNNSYYASQVVELLIRSGKKKIAMITGKENAIVSMERETGYKIALAKHQMEWNAEFILKGNFERDTARECTKEILKKYPDIDGFFCASDYMAIGCMEGIREMGKSIPEDIGVVGFDDIPVSEYLMPSLSTVAQNSYEKGYAAAKLIHEIIRKENTPRIITLECELKMRDSV